MQDEVLSAMPWPQPRLDLARGSASREQTAVGRFSLSRAWLVEVVRNVWPAWLLASILILYGFGWGLPNNPYQEGLSFNADENPAAFGVNQMHLPAMNPGILAWGTAVFYQAWVVRSVVTLHNLIHQQPETIFLIGRGIVYGYVLGTIALVFLLGRKLFGSSTGRMAATLLAVMPGFVQSGHYFKMDVPTTFWIVAALFVAYQTLASRRMLYVILMGLLFGYAASTKYTSGVVLPVGLVAIWLSPPAALNRSRAVLLYLGALAAAFVFGTPYALIRPDLVVAAALEHGDLSVSIGNSASPLGAPAWLDYAIRVLPLSTTLPVAVLAAAGLLLSLFRRDRHLVLLWVAIACYYVYLSLDNYRQVRYTVPLLPLVALLVAYFGHWLCRRGRPWTLCSVAAATVVSYTFLFSLAYVRVMAEVDPRVQASEWLDAHVPKNVPLLVEDTSPTDSPRFDAFGLATIPMDYRPERLRQANASAYLVVSEYATRPFARVTSATPAAEQEFWNLVGTDFVEVTHFENSQKLLWIDAKYDPWSITHDWLQPNPRITIYRRIGP